MSPAKKSVGKRGRPKQAKKLKRVTLTLRPEDWDRFEEIGTANGIATAALIRLAMKEFLDRRRNGRLLAVKLDSRDGD